MNKDLFINNLGEKHALHLYQSQELKQNYLKMRNQILLKAAGIFTLGSLICLGIFYFSSFIVHRLQNFSIAAAIFISLISLLGFIGYQTQFLFRKKNDFIRSFKTDVVRNMIKSLYPELSYHRSERIPLQKLLKTNRYSSNHTLKSWNTQDAISGNYPELDFLLVESTVYGVNKFDENDLYKKMFNGLIIHIQSSKIRKDLDKALKTTAVKKKLDALSRFWGSYPQFTTFYDGDIIIDIVLNKKQFLEPPKNSVTIYDPIYIEQLSQEISLLIEFIGELRAQLKIT